MPKCENKEVIECFNSSISFKEVKLITSKSFPTKKILCPDKIDEFYHKCQSYTNSLRKLRRNEHFPTCFMKVAHLEPKAGKDITEKKFAN